MTPATRPPPTSTWTCNSSTSPTCTAAASSPEPEARVTPSAASATSPPTSGFIHLTAFGTETFPASFQPALKTLDEVETVNRYAALLKARGVNAIILSMHDGAVAGSDFNSGSDPSGPAYDLARQVSPDIDAIVTGHWHCRFNMMVPDPNGVPRPFVEAGCNGQLINEIDLRLDRRRGKVIRELTVSTNHANTQDVAPDPELQEVADYWLDFATKRGQISIRERRFRRARRRGPARPGEPRTGNNLTYGDFRIPC